MRIFLAIDLPGYIKREIMDLEDELKPYVKYIRLSDFNNLHITVKFLDEQNDFALERIEDISKETIRNIDSFEICINKSGIFGSLSNPRILWIGEDNSFFTNMATALNGQLNIFKQDYKKSVCHLTIGRVKYIPTKDIIDAMNICKNFINKNNLRFDVSNVYLYKSNLLRSGAVYEKIEKFNMKEKV